MSERESMAWDMYFASIVSMNLHPGNTKENAVKLSLEDCAKLADQMLIERRSRSKGLGN